MLTVIGVWLSECAWIYLVVRAVTGITNPGLEFTPVVLAPYGAALVVALLLSPLYSPEGTTSKGRRRGFGFAMMLVATLANLVGAAASIAAVAWWELYRGRPLLDPSWLSSIPDDAIRAATTLPPILWLMLLGVILWWRGARLARGEVAFQGLVSRFAWGTVALLILAVAGWLSALETPASTLAVGVYLLAGMAAMAAARLEAAQAERAGIVDRGWRGSSTAVALLLVIAGIGIAVALGPQLEEFAGWVRDWYFGVLLPLLLEILRWIIHLLGLDAPPKPMATPPPGPGTSGPGTDNLFTLPDSIRGALRVVFNLSWMVIILLAVYRWVESWTWGRQRRPKSGYRRERLPWSPLRALRGLLLWLLEMLMRWIPALSAWARHLVVSTERASTVREVYGRLLDWGARRGQERVPWATPREYLATLTSRWPGLEDEFRSITESYLHARYGAVILPDTELERVMAAWASIVAAGHSK